MSKPSKLLKMQLLKAINKYTRNQRASFFKKSLTFEISIFLFFKDCFIVNLKLT